MENTIILTSGEKIEVLFQDEVSLDIDCGLRYIKSGKKEIDNYVENTAKQEINNVIEEARANMTVQIAEGIEDAKAAAETAAATTIADSIITAEQQISSYVSQNITPDLTAAVSAAETSKDAAAGSASAASTAASQAGNSAADATTAKNEAVEAASLATQKAEEAATVTEKVIPPFLSFQFTDHILNNASWLRADTFSWQSGEVYVTAYEHLVGDINGIIAETETIAGYTITFYRATDGHKICLEDQESTVEDIYTATGVAWYYILDTANTRFKLPRTKFGVTGLRGNVGDYVAAGLPNIYTEIATRKFESGVGTVASVTGAGTFNNDGYPAASNVYTYSNGSSTYPLQKITVDASVGNSIYGNSTTVQPPATQMYLYFYVGETVQNAILIDVGEILEELNGKVDVDFSNMNPTQNAKKSIVAWSVPVYTSGISMTSPYTAPSNGFISFIKVMNGGTSDLYVNGKQLIYVTSGGAWFSTEGNFPVKAGDIVTFTGTCNFYPASN